IRKAALEGQLQIITVTRVPFHAWGGNYGNRDGGIAKNGSQTTGRPGGTAPAVRRHQHRPGGNRTGLVQHRSGLRGSDRATGYGSAGGEQEPFGATALFRYT